MYNIQPSSAMTELYNVGKGEAQVLDTSTAENALRYNAAKQEAQRAARAKKLEEARKRSTDLLNNQVGEVHPADLPAFQKQGQEYRKAVLDAVKKGGGDLSIEDESALNQQFNVMTQNALASKDRLTQEKQALSKFNNPNEFYRTGEHQKAHEGFAKSSFDDKGVADFSPKVNPVAQYDILKDVNDLSARVTQETEANKVYGKTGIPFAQSAEYARSIGDNPAAAKDIHGQMVEMVSDGTYNDFISKVYGSPKTEAGVDNPSYIADPKLREAKLAEIAGNPDNLKHGHNRDITAYEFTDRFIRKGQDPQPQGVNIGIGSKAYESMPNTYIDPKTKTMETYTGTKGEEALTTKTTYGGEPVLATPPQEIRFGDNGEVLGSKMTIKPSPAQMAENAAVKNQNRQNKKELAKQLSEQGLTEPPKRDTGIFGAFADTDEEYKKKLKEYNAEVDALKAQYPDDKEPYPERSVPLSAEETKKHYFETWGVPIEKVIKDKEKTPGMKVHVEPNSKGTTKVENTNGEKTWNGHKYTLDEIKMMGKSAGKTDAEITTLWNSLK